MPIVHKTLRSKVFQRLKALYDAGKLKGAPAKWGGSRGAFAFINKLVSKQISDVEVSTKDLNAFLTKVEKAVRSGKLRPAKGARKVVKAGKVAASCAKTTKLVKSAKKHAVKTGARAKQQLKVRAKSVKKAGKGNRRVAKLRKKVAKKEITSRSLSRSRAKYPTARMAWQSIEDATGLKPARVFSLHTDKSWSWKLIENKTDAALAKRKKKLAAANQKAHGKRVKGEMKQAVKASKQAQKAKRAYHKAAKAGHKPKPKEAIFAMLETSKGRAIKRGKGLAVVKFRPSLIEISGSAVIDMTRSMSESGKAIAKRLWFRRIASDRLEAMELKNKEVIFGPAIIIRPKPRRKE